MAYNCKKKLPVLDINMRAEVSSSRKTLSYVITVENTRSFRQTCKLVTVGWNAREETLFPSNKSTCMRPEPKTNHELWQKRTTEFRVCSQLSLLVFQMSELSDNQSKKPQMSLQCHVISQIPEVSLSAGWIEHVTTDCSFIPSAWLC